MVANNGTIQFRDVDAVLFDLDGVLVDSFEVWVSVLGDCRTRRGLEPLTDRQLRACWGQGINADCQNLFPGATPDELAVEYNSGFTRHVDRIRSIPGAQQLAKRVHASGRRAAVVTNSPMDLAVSVLQVLDMSNCFDTICGGDEVPRGKPDPALLELALDRLSVSAERAVMIGDTILDVTAARAAGVWAIGFGVMGDEAVNSLHEIRERIDCRREPPLNRE